jgi:hypothetical protein
VAGVTAVLVSVVGGCVRLEVAAELMPERVTVSLSSLGLLIALANFQPGEVSVTP